jgi:hypothetical protein
MKQEKKIQLKSYKNARGSYVIEFLNEYGDEYGFLKLSNEQTGKGRIMDEFELWMHRDYLWVLTLGASVLAKFGETVCTTKLGILTARRMWNKLQECGFEAVL